MVQNPSFDKNTLALSKLALINECNANNVDLNKLKYFLNYEIDKLFTSYPINETWETWRHNKLYKNRYNGYEKAEHITDKKNLPPKLSVFLNQFKNALEVKGFNIELINDIEINPTKTEIKQSEQNTDIKIDTNRVLEEQKISIWSRIKKYLK